MWYTKLAEVELAIFNNSLLLKIIPIITSIHIYNDNYDDLNVFSVTCINFILCLLVTATFLHGALSFGMLYCCVQLPSWRNKDLYI